MSAIQAKGIFLLLLSLVNFVQAEAMVLEVPGLGSLRGSLSTFSSNIAIFNRIPYAKPPTPLNDLRWRPPEAYGPWKEQPRDATAFGAACLSTTPQLWANVSASENCLFLNIAAPLQNSSLLPVMVFFHGGGFLEGASNYNRPDSLVSASKSSVVVVTLNYRLHAFGFLGGAAMRGRSSDKSIGNYGIMDQREALRWVRDYISAFGGNPGSVTIFGESAGGESVVSHLTQAASYGLYHRAIIESGCDDPFVCATGTCKSTYPSSNESYTSVLNHSGCSNLECLLRASPEAIVKAAAGMGDVWGPVIDGVALMDRPQALLARGRYNNRVPILLGSNRDEYSLFVVPRENYRGWPANMSTVELETHLLNLFQGNATTVAQVMVLYSPRGSYPYPQHLGQYSPAWWMAMRVSTDGGSPVSNALGHCTARRYARWMHAGKSPSVYQYLFAHPGDEALLDLNSGGYPLPGTEPGGVLVPHASELPFVFGRLERLSHQERGLALTMVAYWVQFAKTGDPNHLDMPKWPQHTTKNDTVLQFDSEQTAHAEHNTRKEACDFWDTLAEAKI